MPDTPIQFTGALLERLETKVATEAPHLLPIVQAIRDHGVGFLVIPQRATGLHRGIKLLQRPFIVMVGDDTDCALGPLFLTAFVYMIFGFVGGAVIREFCYVPRNFWQGIIVLSGMSNWGNLRTSCVP